MGKLHVTPVDRGNQSLLASPLSETKPHSPIPADQLSLQGELSDDLQLDPPVVAGTIKGCLHHTTKLCQSCQVSCTCTIPTV